MSRFRGCKLLKNVSRLPADFIWGSCLSLDNLGVFGSNNMVFCNSYDSWESCFSHISDNWYSMPKTYEKHPFARLAHFNNRPVLFSGKGNRQAEVLNRVGIWETVYAHAPEPLHDYATISRVLEDEIYSYSLIIGGRNDDNELSDAIFKFAPKGRISAKKLLQCEVCHNLRLIIA